MTAHTGTVAPFAHFLLGMYKPSISVSGISGNLSITAFTFGAGGGAAFRITRNFGVETAADYLRPQKYGVSLNNIRVTIGPVFYFGGSRRDVGSYTPVPAPVAPASVASSVPMPVVAPPSAPKCIETVTDPNGVETCMRYANQQ